MRTLCYLNEQSEERWQSGLMRTLGKRVSAKVDRGFESRSLRNDLRVQFGRLCAQFIISKVVRDSKDGLSEAKESGQESHNIFGVCE